jgi:hypothetical protein
VINGNFHPAEAGGTASECANAAPKEWQDKVKTQSRYFTITIQIQKYRQLTIKADMCYNLPAYKL